MEKLRAAIEKAREQRAGASAPKPPRKDAVVGATPVAESIEAWNVLPPIVLDHKGLIDGMVNAFEGDPEHMCMGRSAPARLQRALVLAAGENLSLTTLERIAAETNGK